MFKSVRWRSDKNKITAVFKLSFHATQVSQFGGSGLVLSLVPADTGKPAAKLENSEIRDGCCYWENAIIETVKLVQGPKNGKIHDRIYNFIISRGSSKLSTVGEVSLNISEYVEATKPASVSLPITGTNSDAILHVSIQRIQENVNQREVEEHEVAKIKPEDRSLKRYFGTGDSEENIHTNSNEEKPLRKTVPNVTELNGNGRASIGSDITLSGSDHTSGMDNPQELGRKSNDILMDTQNASIEHNQQRTGWEWSLAATNDSSTDDSTKSQRDTLDDSAEKIKLDLILLSRKADVADMELQTLRKQIVKESKIGQDLLKEVTCLKEERDAFKEECEQLKASQKARNKMNYEGDPWALLEEMRQELNHEKDINADLRLQLHKTQESNSELILAVQDLEQLLEQANGGGLDGSIKPVSCNISENLEGRAQEAQGQNSDDDDNDDQKALEELVKHHSDAKDAYILEQRIMDLCSEIEMNRRDKDELEMQMEQMALDYEILKQENHDMSYKLEQTNLQQQLKLQYECSGSYATIHELDNQVEKLERELDNSSNEFSDSLAIIKDLENHTQSLEDELEKQAQRFKAELEALACGKREKEQKAIQTEEAFESVRNELASRIEMLDSELKKQCKEFSDAMATIKELEGHIQNLEEELDKQAQGFESDLQAITRAKVEQEQRAIRAEEDLRLTRWKNANTAGRLQDEFRRLSTKMQSTFEANEKVASKAMTEASQLRLMNNHLEELLQQARDELQSFKEEYEVQVSDLHKQLNLKSKQMDQMLVEIEGKSNQLESQREDDGEVCQSLSAELLMVRAEVDRLTSETASLHAQIEQGEELKAELEQVKMLVQERDLLVEKLERERDSLENVADSSRKEADESLKELNAIRCFNDEKDTSLGNLQTEVDTLRAQCEELKHSLFEDEMEKEKLRKQVFQLKAELKKKDDALTIMERKLKDNNGWVVAVEGTKASSKNSKTEIALRSSKEAASLKEKIKLLEGQIKQKEVSMDTSANAFLEKEKDLLNKIEELERRLEELVQGNIICHEDDCGKDDGIARELTLNADSHKLNGNDIHTAINSNGEVASTTVNSRDEHDFHALLLKEMASLREENTFMEAELKEMQERYSEISLKFAEVEGERQRLVMTLRNIKKA